jgi:hypothetical protein
MNKFLGILLLLPGLVLAEGQIVNPNITPTWTVTCEYPTEREDNTQLLRNEIAKVEFYVSTDKTDWRPAGENASACRQVYNLTDIADGQYYYTTIAVDTDGRMSLMSIDAPSVGESGYTALVVKRPSLPKPPTGHDGAASSAP